MVLSTLQTTTGVAIAGSGTATTIGFGGYPIVKDGDDFIIDTAVVRKELTTSLVTTGVVLGANCLSGLSAQAVEVNDTKAYIESLSDEELARLCEIDSPEIVSSPKTLKK